MTKNYGYYAGHNSPQLSEDYRGPEPELFDQDWDEPQGKHREACCTWHSDDDCNCADPSECTHLTLAQRIDLIAPASDEEES